MKIAVILNVHGNTDLVLDTIDSITTYVSKDVVVIVDGASWEWGKDLNLSVSKLRGFYHGCPKSPYRNITLGLAETLEYVDADWYCYTEYDTLFVSDAFKKDLELAANQGVWAIGNDVRTYAMQFPMLESLFDMKFDYTRYLLGCCVFYKREFLKTLQDIDFFEKFLNLTMQFPKGFFPGCDKQNIYDPAEHIYPTLADKLGGKVAQFAAYDDKTDKWRGNYEKYLMRWQPQITKVYKNSSIIHPLKDFNNPIREFYREKRKNEH